MIYLLVGNDVAVTLSQSLCRLASPAATDDMYCDVLTHPSTGHRALVLPETDTVPIQQDANASGLEALLESFVFSGALTKLESDAITAAVISNQGKRVCVADFIPPSWMQWTRTHLQMVADGWLPAP